MYPGCVLLLLVLNLNDFSVGHIRKKLDLHLKTAYEEKLLFYYLL